MLIITDIYENKTVLGRGEKTATLRHCLEGVTARSGFDHDKVYKAALREQSNRGVQVFFKINRRDILRGGVAFKFKLKFTVFFV